MYSIHDVDASNVKFEGVEAPKRASDLYHSDSLAKQMKEESMKESAKNRYRKGTKNRFVDPFF